MQENYQDENKEQEIGTNPSQPQSLNKSQKIAVIFLAFFAVFVVILWSVQFKKSITEPFVYKGDSSDKQIGVCQGSGCQEDSEEFLRSKDTDGDGLSDWDEFNIYNTSPYLEDSDSDGFSDGEEVNSENDPSCPTGRDCYGGGLVDENEAGVSENLNVNASESPAGASDGAEENSINSLLNQLGANASESTAGDTGAGGAVDLEAFLSGQIDAAGLRQLLLEYGMEKKILDQFNDEELMESFREMMPVN